jgi:hypothetical protein
MKTLNGRVHATNERLEGGFAQIDRRLGPPAVPGERGVP